MPSIAITKWYVRQLGVCQCVVWLSVTCNRINDDHIDIGIVGATDQCHKWSIFGWLNDGWLVAWVGITRHRFGTAFHSQALSDSHKRLICLMISFCWLFQWSARYETLLRDAWNTTTICVLVLVLNALQALQAVRAQKAIIVIDVISLLSKLQINQSLAYN